MRWPRSIRNVLFTLGFLALGCGKSSPPPQPPPVMPAPPPVTHAAESHHKSKSTEKHSKAGSTWRAPAGTDPKTVFVVDQIGEPMEIEREVAVLPDDQYRVIMANVSSKSSDFVVEAVQPSKLKPQMVGQSQATSTHLTLPRGFAPISAVGYSEDGLPLRIVCEKTGRVLALVPGGTSIVGSGTGPAESQPAFKVRLDPFYMEILEVTLEDYEKYRAEQKEKKKTAPAPSNPNDLPNMPVLGITWMQAQTYARWAGMDLPTEAEFEKAARGPTGFRTPWGEGRPLWTTHPLAVVGAYPSDSSPYGILDLAANAKEWCADIYSATSHAEAHKESSNDFLHNWAGPKNSKTSNLRVVKGSGSDWSVWHREGKELSKGHPDVGFRCVLRLMRH